MLTKVNGEDGVEVREKVYDNGDYNNGNYSYMNAGELGASTDDGSSYIAINTQAIDFNTLDSNDDPVSGSLSISVRGELQWNGDDLAYASDILPIPACPTTTDGHYMLAATVSSGVVTYSWEPVATASGIRF
jgi:hypothetical protein